MRTRKVFATGLIAAVGLSLQALPAAAFEFSVGPVDGSVRQQVMWGAMWSVQSANDRYVHTSNGGTNLDPTRDDGKLNYNTGLISNQVKGRTELNLQFGGLGSDIMGTVTKVLYFYDFMEKDHRKRFRDVNGASEEEIAADIRFLENYAFWEGTIADEYPLAVRIGDQVINWGEANLILGTNSYTNSVNFNRILSPTFDLEEVYDPFGAIYASFGVNADIAIDAYVQYDWQPHRIPPGGSFFATTDYAGAGIQDSGVGFLCLSSAPFDRPGSPTSPLCGNLSDDEDASQIGQWGIRGSFILTELNNTQLNLYFIRYHDRLPHVVVQSAGGLPNFTQPGFAPGPADIQVALGYTEDINVWGASFNTTIVDGIAWSGEVTLREDVPLQVQSVEVQCATAYIGLVPAGPGAGTPVSLRAANPALCGGTSLPLYAPGQRFDTGIPHNVLDASTAFFKTFPQALGGNNLLALFEVGVSRVMGMDDDILFDTTDVGETLNTRRGATYAADDFGWGYRLLLTNEYTRFSSIFQNVNMAVKPLLIFSHDVNGNTVKNLASYAEGKKQLVTGVTLDYQNQYAVTIRYSTFFGNKDVNILSDRDTISLTLSADF